MITVFNKDTGKKMLSGKIPQKRIDKLKAEGHTVKKGRFDGDVKLVGGSVVADIDLMTEKAQADADKKKRRKDKRAAVKAIAGLDGDFLKADNTLDDQKVNDALVLSMSIIKGLL